MSRKKEIDALISRYQNGTCTPEEQEKIERMLFADPDRRVNVSDLDSYGEEVWDRIYPIVRNKTPSLKRWYYAAAAILIIGLPAYLFFESRMNAIPDENTVTADVVPGTTKATLTLADGGVIALDSTHTGIIINADEITYSDGNRLLALDNRHAGDQAIRAQYAVLATPRGGTYQLILSDGTKVWLNAASTLRYPIEFKGDSREIEIDGEAYFDVVQIPSMPFIVKSRGQETIVLGTEFNISAYEDEDAVKTTVVSGSVRVRTKIKTADGGYKAHMDKDLHPQEQTIVTSTGSLTLQKVNAESVVAWKSGNFHFKGTPLADMMRQIARWYDLEVIYTSQIPQETFSGKLTRGASLANILEFLRDAGISCRMDGRKLFIG